MSNTVIPITLQAAPVPATATYPTLTELMQLVAQYVSGTVTNNVTFFLQGATDPATDQGVIFYNTTQGVFKVWSASAGAYVVTGQNTPLGSVMFDNVNGDELSAGWVLAAGSRTIDSISGLSVAQNAALHTLYGAGATVQVPNVTAPASSFGGGPGTGATLYGKVFAGYP